MVLESKQKINSYKLETPTQWKNDLQNEINNFH